MAVSVAGYRSLDMPSSVRPKRALEEGVSCQPLIASILHKYIEGRLSEGEG